MKAKPNTNPKQIYKCLEFILHLVFIVFSQKKNIMSGHTMQVRLTQNHKN